MQLFETYKKIPKNALSSVVVIGNFDGVHCGHKALLDKAKEIAKEKNLTVSVLTFEPHPRRLFRPDDPPFRITPAALKQERLEHAGVDHIFSVGFDWDFASMTAEDFVQDVLVDGLKPAHVVVGFNFHFGQLRKGNARMIEQAGLPVSVVEEVSGVSSTNIRQALRYGHIAEANDLLGWEWEIWGNVIKGDQRGRELGYPTANFSLKETIHPAYGVYAAWVQVEGEDTWRPAAVNIGIRPMFEIPEALVESYIFDFDREIYEQVLKVKPVQFLRGEAKFNVVEDLISQMEKDCLQAREILEG